MHQQAASLSHLYVKNTDRNTKNSKEYASRCQSSLTGTLEHPYKLAYLWELQFMAVGTARKEYVMNFYTLESM